MLCSRGEKRPLTDKLKYKHAFQGLEDPFCIERMKQNFMA